VYFFFTFLAIQLSLIYHFPFPYCKRVYLNIYTSQQFSAAWTFPEENIKRGYWLSLKEGVCRSYILIKEVVWHQMISPNSVVVVASVIVLDKMSITLPNMVK
jgi:hypothetical protein